jgi:hypothetical protein
MIEASLFVDELERSMTVIEHDFGKNSKDKNSGKDKAKRLTKLLTLEAQHEANVLANPLPYLDAAAERFSQLEMAVTEAANAANYDPPGYEPTGERVEIDKAEYERLLRCKQLLEAAVAKL